ncbi:hypothetical protein CBF23_004025 [Marinomonas agarivorans]|nr:hypothetical protein CBF23_004025 [Marinomonas agarivorans]
MLSIETLEDITALSESVDVECKFAQARVEDMHKERVDEGGSLFQKNSSGDLEPMIRDKRLHYQYPTIPNKGI